MERGGWVYITANRYRGGMYVGVLADVIRRVYQHREGTGSTHVRNFGKTRLVYVEHHSEIAAAIAREKLVKKWRREWKFALIEADNPDWIDLWDKWFAKPADEMSQAPCQARGDDGIRNLWRFGRYTRPFPPPRNKSGATQGGAND